MEKITTQVNDIEDIGDLCVSYIFPAYESIDYSRGRERRNDQKIRQRPLRAKMDFEDSIVRMIDCDRSNGVKELLLLLFLCSDFFITTLMECSDCKRVLIYFLRKNGWSSTKITKTFQELREYLVVP